ncbi:MAG: prefoldin subunit beta [Candidatus Diapherotrites archaeon]
MVEPSMEDLQEFNKSRNQLMSVSAQKQQLQFQASMLESALEELDKTSEKKVFKAVGNILIAVDTKKAQTELKSQKESTDLRLKSLSKQEDTLMGKLNKLKSKMEGKSDSDKEESGKGSKKEK